MVLYPNKLPESERVCSGICTYSQKEKMKTENYHKFIYGNIVPMKKRVGVLCECKRTHIQNQ